MKKSQNMPNFAKNRIVSAYLKSESFIKQMESELVLPASLSASLFSALETDDIASLQDVLDKFEDYNLEITNYPPNCPACLTKHPFIVDVAAYYSSINCLRFLLSNIEEVKHTDKAGRTLAHFAAYKGGDEMVALLSEFGISFDTEADGKILPIHIAAKYGNTHFCQLLWPTGVKLDCITDNGYAPIHLAGEHYKIDTLDFLRKAGCDLNQLTGSGLTLYHLAIRTDNYDLLYYLFENNVPQRPDTKGRYPIHEAVYKRLPDLVEALVRNGAIVNCADANQVTPLHTAARRGCYPVAIFLLDSGANMNAIDDKGRMPIHYAALNGSLEIIDLLCDYGAEYEIYDFEDHTPMNLAYINRKLECVDFFSDMGMDNNNIEIDTVAKDSKRKKRSPKWGFRARGFAEISAY